MELLAQIFDLNLLTLTARVVAPILLAALGGLLCARSGVFNVALEGMMLVGAFGAVLAAAKLGSVAAGVMGGLAGGLLVALIFALLAVELQADPIVLGIALNLFAVGATAYGLRVALQVTGTYYDPDLPGLSAVRLPLIAALPGLGRALSGHTWLVYLAWLLVPAVWWLLFRQVLGLRLRAVGENALAAETLGVSPRRMRYVAIFSSGALAGLAGTQLAIGQLRSFSENMTAGRGFIALVAVIFGRAHPLGVFAASLLFGLMEAIGLRLSAISEAERGNLPVQFIYMLPYLATLLALVLLRGRSLTLRPAGDPAELAEAKSG